MVSGSCWIETGLCDVSMVVFNVYMDGVVREVNTRVNGKGLELSIVNGGRFEINQLLLAEDTAPAADSREVM